MNEELNDEHAGNPLLSYVRQSREIKGVLPPSLTAKQQSKDVTIADLGIDLSQVSEEVDVVDIDSDDSEQRPPHLVTNVVEFKAKALSAAKGGLKVANAAAEKVGRAVPAEKDEQSNVLRFKGWIIISGFLLTVMPLTWLFFSLVNENRAYKAKELEQLKASQMTAEQQLEMYKGFYEKVANEEDYLCELNDSYARTNCDLLIRLTNEVDGKVSQYKLNER